MTPTDRQLVTLAGWPGGVNNREPEDQLPVDENGRQTSLRQAVNTDLDRDGKPSRRPGYEQVVDADAHSLFAAPQGMLCVIDGDLKLYDENLSGSTLISALGDRPVSYAVAGGETFWTNNFRIGRIAADGSVKPVWIDAPGQPTVAAYATGALPAGNYQVAITYLDAGGRESGSSLATVVTLTAGQGIRLTNIPSNADAATVRIYVYPQDGDGLYWAADVPAGTTTYVIGLGERGKLLETQWLEPLPPGQCIRYYNGVVLVAKDNVIWRSDAFRFGLKRYDAYARYSDYVSLMEPIGEVDLTGVFIAAGKRTYFLRGNPNDWSQVIAYPHGAIEGTACIASGSDFGLETANRVLYWVADNGVPVLGLPSGQVVPLTDKRFVTPLADRGATLFRDSNGIRQTITSLLGSHTNKAAVSDFATAEVRRNGVTL